MTQHVNNSVTAQYRANREQ